MMLDFTKFSKNIKLRPSDVNIDNFVFKLHYRITFWFLLACTLLVSSKQFIKEHIQCISDQSLKHVINTFCFFSSTFTIARLNNASYVPGVHVVSPGTGAEYADDEKKYHAYYQWVPFLLGIQAIFFYLPRYIWKASEKKRLRAIINCVKSAPYTAESDITIKGYKIDSLQTKKKKENLLKETYLSRSRLMINRDWAKNLIICEFLNFLNLIFQIKIVDMYLKGNFLDLGVQWVKNGDDVLECVFPKVTKCTFHKFGKSGSIQNHDALCIMSLNIINEKLYLLMWFWFLILLVATTVGLLWRLLSITLHSNVLFNRLLWSEVCSGVPLKVAEIETVASKLTFSDWLFLRYIGKNLDFRMFQAVITDIHLSFSSNSQMTFSKKRET